jgi:putative transcriptional regulator
MTCVLTGAFRQEGVLYGPGDFDSGEENDRHELRAENGADCLCLIALQGELRWRGFFGRLIQPFIRV